MSPKGTVRKRLTYTRKFSFPRYGGEAVQMRAAIKKEGRSDGSDRLRIPRHVDRDAEGSSETQPAEPRRACRQPAVNVHSPRKEYAGGKAHTPGDGAEDAGRRSAGGVRANEPMISVRTNTAHMLEMAAGFPVRRLHARVPPAHAEDTGKGPVENGPRTRRAPSARWDYFLMNDKCASTGRFHLQVLSVSSAWAGGTRNRRTKAAAISACAPYSAETESSACLRGTPPADIAAGAPIARRMRGLAPHTLARQMHVHGRAGDSASFNGLLSKIRRPGQRAAVSTDSSEPSGGARLPPASEHNFTTIREGELS